MKILLTGTCLVPADAKCEPGLSAGDASQGHLELVGTTIQNQNNPTNPMTITIQYKIYPDSQSEPQKVAVQRDLVDIISEAPNAQDPTGGAGGGQTPASVASESNATTPVIQASSAMGGQPQTVIAKSTAKVVKFAGGTAMNHIVLAFLF